MADVVSEPAEAAFCQVGVLEHVFSKMATFKEICNKTLAHRYN